MSTIEINRTHDMTPADCDAALEELSSYLRGDLGANVSHRGERLTFTGKGFQGEVCIKPGQAKASIKLGLLAKPFKRHLETEINRQLDARLGSQ